MLNSTGFNLLSSHVVCSHNSLIRSLHGALYESAFIIYLFLRLNSSSLLCSLWRGSWYICSKNSRKYLSGILIVNGRLDQNSAMLIICCVCSVVELCLTLCSPMDCSLPGSSVHRIFQARILEWVSTSFSTGSSRPRDRTRSPAFPALAGRFSSH